MKIIHFHSNGVMASKFIAPLLHCENANGFESVIFTSSNSVEDVNSFQISFDLCYKNLFKLPFTFINICFMLFKEKPNLVISHNCRSSLLPLLAAWVMRVPKIIYFNHGVSYIAYSGVLNKALKFLEILNLKLSTHVITVSKEMSALLSALSPHKRIDVIANGSACGIDLIKYTRSHSILNKFMRNMGICDDDIVFVYIGRPEIRKGFGVILELWKDAFSLKKNYKLLLCGPNKNNVKKILGSVPSNIYALDFVNNVPEILANAKYLLLPSFHEGLSYAVLEALASGCLVLANDIHGNRSAITHGVNGFLISGNSIEAYRQTIEMLENSSSILICDIIDRAIQSSRKFSRDVFLSEYIKYLYKVLNDRLTQSSFL